MSHQIQGKAPETSSSPLRDDYDYEVDDVLAFRAGDVDNPLPCCTGRVSETQKTEEKVTHLTVH